MDYKGGLLLFKSDDWSQKLLATKALLNLIFIVI